MGSGVMNDGGGSLTAIMLTQPWKSLLSCACDTLLCPFSNLAMPMRRVKASQTCSIQFDLGGKMPLCLLAISLHDQAAGLCSTQRRAACLLQRQRVVMPGWRQTSLHINHCCRMQPEGHNVACAHTVGTHKAGKKKCVEGQWRASLPSFVAFLVVEGIGMLHAWGETGITRRCGIEHNR